jgi:hypothetical protein
MKNDSWSVIIGFANPQLHLAKQLGREILRQEWSSLRRNFRFEATASGSIAPDREDFYRAFHGFGILHFAFCILHFLIRVNLRANAFLSQFAAVQKTLLF